INIEDDCQFINTLKGRQAEYVIMLPSRTDERLYREISSRARLVHKGGGGTRREIELWKKHSSP
ncbi:MAG: hypothetical protein RBT82_11645, partial [Desulfomonilia bacterium]|nr:hypothetical protein [Desulfomonilia bacterium]